MQRSKSSIQLIFLVEAAMFLALAYLLPFLTGQIQAFGQMLSPMHLPVLLCGMVCGPWWGAAVGFSAPLLRSLTLGMPPIAVAPAMAVELAVYGLVAGLARRLLPRKPLYLYIGLISAMLAGRAAYGVAMLILTGIRGGTYGLRTYFTAVFLNCWPGILLQLIVIPPLVFVIDRWHRKNGIPLPGVEKNEQKNGGFYVESSN